MKVICQNPKCGKVFDVKPSDLARGGGKHCSRACYFHKTPEERFWSKVRVGDDAECWTWLGGLTRDGYGRFNVKMKTVRAHRFSWQIHNGPIPRGALVCHHCDTPRCINPKHLFIGNNQTNMDDMAQKGRSLKGEKNPSAKLTWQDVREIRKLYRWRGIGGPTKTELASRYSVTRTAIYLIVTGKSWKEVA